MTPQAQSASRRDLLLGIEAGGTRTVALLADAKGHSLERIEMGPANLRLVSASDLLRRFRELARQIPRPSAVGIGMAGLRTDADRLRVKAAVMRVWGNVPAWIGSDLDTAMVAAGGVEQGPTRVLVLSGTGSCCFGRRFNSRAIKVGGWGHILGDRGSGFEIAMNALRTVIAQYDLTGRWPQLGARLLRAVMLNEPDDLIAWTQTASKDEVARLAPEVFTALRVGDQLAGAVVREAAQRLSRDALTCARRLAGPYQPVRFVLAGGVLLGQRGFAALVRDELRRGRPASTIERLQREGAWGAVELARRALAAADSPGVKLPQARTTANPAHSGLPTSRKLSSTEDRNPRSVKLDQLPLSKAVRLMIAEDQLIPAALLREVTAITRAIRLIVSALRRGGRLFYVGAGTSGRLGVLDASECPPTFGTLPDLVQGVIAGGAAALGRAVEGAEDDFPAGVSAMKFRRLCRKDVVVGIAASGRTPFVWGALHCARERCARTVLLCFNPHLRFARTIRPDVVINPRTGPEILTGSTRLKAGTATKTVLNLFSTLAMVRLGKVISNLMVDLKPSNAKLRDRAIRIVQELTGSSQQAARESLQRAGWVVRDAVARVSTE